MRHPGIRIISVTGWHCVIATRSIGWYGRSDYPATLSYWTVAW